MLNDAVLKMNWVTNTGRSKGWRKTNVAPSAMSWTTWRRAAGGRVGSKIPASSTTAMTDNAAAKPKAGAAPTQPTRTPPKAGPLANATVRASSMRAFAAGRDFGGTSEGTSEGAATL